MSIEIVPYSKDFDRTLFRSGKEQLDRWIVNYASQSEARLEMRTFLAVDSDDQKVVGYYSSKVFTVQPDENNDWLAEYFNLTYPLPAYLLGKLAVDSKFQKQGIGSNLLAHALRKAVEISSSAGLQLVVVEAIDNDAASFYGSHDFTKFRDSSNMLFLPIKTLIASI